MTSSVCTDKPFTQPEILTQLVHFFPKTQQIKSNKEVVALLQKDHKTSMNGSRGSN